MNTYLQGVAARVLHPGMLLVLLGAAAVFLAGKAAEKRYPDRKEARDALTVRIKAGGCAMIAAGAVMILI